MKIKARNLSGENLVGKIMEDKELKKKLSKIPDVDENGDPIYKIDVDPGRKNEAPKTPEKKD
jgi:hypothetical protein